MSKEDEKGFVVENAKVMTELGTTAMLLEIQRASP